MKRLSRFLLAHTLASAAFALSVILGCGQSSGVQTEVVKGKVVIKGGDVGRLVGGYVRFESVSDPTVKAVGEIEDGGEFVMGTFVNDKPVGGVVAGNYRAKIELKDSEQRVPGRPPINRRYLDFKTSHLQYTVVKGENNFTIELDKP